jgi:O-antigen ligase
MQNTRPGGVSQTLSLDEADRRALCTDTPWYFDVVAWTAALSFVGYPLVGLAAAYLSIVDDRLALAFRIGVAGLALVVFCLNSSRYDVKLPHAGLVLFMILYSARLLWDTGRASQPDADHILLMYAAFVVIPLFALVIPMAPWRIPNILSCCFCITSASVVVALTLHIAGFSVDPEQGVTYRLSFDRLNPITLGHTASLSLLSVLIGWHRWRSRWKLASLLVVPASVLVLILAASRGPLLAFITTTVLYCILKRYWLVLMLLAGTGYLVIAAMPAIDGESLFDRLRLATELRADVTAMERLALGEIAWNELLENPLFGSGFSLPGMGGYPHNIVLESGMAMGVVGLALLLVLIGWTIWKAITGLVAERGDAFAASFFIYDLISSQFSGALWAQTILFVTMGRLLSYPLRDPVSVSDVRSSSEVSELVAVGPKAPATDGPFKHQSRRI